MARHNVEVENESFETSTPASRYASRAHGRADVASLSPSPTASFSSDKENRSAAQLSARQKSKSASMAPPQRPTPESSVRPSKKRKLAERDPPTASQAAYQKQLAQAEDTRYYDPNQSIEERRAVRKEYRELARDLTGESLMPTSSTSLTWDFLDQRVDYLAPGSDGLKKTVERQNELYAGVKQTSDATLDSRLLVSAADLSAKRTTQLNLGDSTTGIDVDDFVNKCKSFMIRGEAAANRRRNRQADSDDEAGEGRDEGDAFDWDTLGRKACCPNNLRPPMPGFLLGPLSVQKRIRKVTQRRERFQKRDPNDAVRPEELKAQDLEKADNANLTTLCRRIRETLISHIKKAEEAVEQEASDDLTEDEVHALMQKHGIAGDGGMPFFQFVINPKSFGQSVENLFYTSFLIRDGLCGLGNDHNLLPTLR